MKLQLSKQKQIISLNLLSIVISGIFSVIIFAIEVHFKFCLEADCPVKSVSFHQSTLMGLKSKSFIIYSNLQLYQQNEKLAGQFATPKKLAGFVG
jgi:hypothetical protein